MISTKHLTRHSVLLLIFVGMFSFASAQEFQDQLALSESTGDSFDLHTATYREHMYVMWQDDTLKQDEIFFRASHDNGKTFDDTTSISRTKGDSIHPKLYSQDSHVYVLWVEPQDSDAKLVLRTSSNFGKTFADPIILADKTVQDKSGAFAAATFDNNLYVVWLENSDSSFPKMILRSSADHGKTFSDQTYLSGANNISLTESEYLQLAISTNNLYVSWTGQDASGHIGVFFAKINHDSMGKISQLSHIGEDFSLDHIIASEDDVYVLMQKQVNIKSAYSEIDQNEEVVVFSNNTGTTFSNPINFTKNLATESRAFGEGEILPLGQDIHIRLVKINSPEKENSLHLYTIPKNFSKFRSDNFTADIASLGQDSKQRIVSLGNVIYTIYERVASQRELVVASSHNGVIADLAILSNRLSGSYSYDPQIMSTLDGVMHVAWIDLSRGTNMQYNQDIFFAKNATDNTSVVNLSAKMPKQAEYFAIDKLDVNYFDTSAAQPETEITQKPKPKPVPTSEPVPEPYFEPKSDLVESPILTPLQQFRSGVSWFEIKCAEDKVIVLKSNEHPACVNFESAIKLYKRGAVSNMENAVWYDLAKKIVQNYFEDKLAHMYNIEENSTMIGLVGVRESLPPLITIGLRFTSVDVEEHQKTEHQFWFGVNNGDNIEKILELGSDGEMKTEIPIEK